MDILKRIVKQIEKLWLPRIPDGVVSDEPTGFEFDYGAIESINPSTLKNISNVSMLKFNQGKYVLTKQACTIVNSIRALMKTASGYYGYVPTTQDVFDSVEFAKTMGYKVGKGWNVPSGVDAARKRWNERHPEMAMTSTRITESDPDFYKLLDLGYALVGSYKGSTLYTNDYRDNAILEGKTFGPQTYGHCTDREKGVVCNDSYDGNWYNIYKILFPSDVIKNKVWNANFYLFTPMHDNQAEIKRLSSLKAETQTSITANSNAYNLTSDEEYKMFLNSTNNRLREKLSEIDVELKKL